MSTQLLIQKKSPIKSSRASNLRHFSVLERKVNAAFEQGLKRAKDAVEVEKTRTYLAVGGFIEAHLLFHKDRADYGKELMPRLAKSTGKSTTLLYDCLRFARQRAILPARVELLPWGIYKGLLSVEDSKQRDRFVAKARAENWSTRDLAKQLQQIQSPGKPEPLAAPAPNPKRGEFYHYRVVVSGVPGKPLQLDLGFNAFLDVPAGARNIKEEDIVISVALDPVKGRHGKYKVRRVDGPMPVKQNKLFTYWAYVLRVIDADTLLAWMELGFGEGRKERLRLRGLDAPEIHTKRGKAAKAFVESQLKNSRWVVVSTSVDKDRYDRYLADVFSSPEPESGKPSPEAWSSYLNRELVDKGFAEMTQRQQR